MNGKWIYAGQRSLRASVRERVRKLKRLEKIERRKNHKQITQQKDIIPFRLSFQDAIVWLTTPTDRNGKALTY